MCLQISSTNANEFVFKYAGFYWGWKEFLLMYDGKNDNYQLLPSMVQGKKYYVHQVADGLLIYPRENAIQPVQFLFNVVPEGLTTFRDRHFKVAVGIIGMNLGCHISKLSMNNLSDFNVPVIEKFDYLEDNPELPARFHFSSFTCFGDLHIQMVGDYDVVVAKCLLPKPELLDNFIMDVFNEFLIINGKSELNYSKEAYENIYNKIMKGE